MRKFLLKKLIKNSEDVKNPAVRESYGKLAGIVGIVSNTVLCLFKILMGLGFGSVAILADGINNLSDAASSLTTFLGFKLAGKPADKDHPYGHGRTEYMAGLLVSVMVLAIGFSLLKSSIEKTVNPEEIEFSALTIVVLVAAILVKIWQASFNVGVGKLIDSEALMATGADSRNDVISTAAVLASVLINKFAGVNIDGPIGILVALFIIWSGIQLVRDSTNPILGKAPDPELTKALKEEILSHEGVLGMHDLMIHDYGPGRLFASVHVEVDADANFLRTHNEVDIIESNVMKKFNMLISCHMDPVRLNDPITEEIKEHLESIVSNEPDILDFHDVRVVAGPIHTNVVFDIVLSLDSKMSPQECCERVDAELKKINPKYNSVISIDRDYTGEFNSLN